MMRSAGLAIGAAIVAAAHAFGTAAVAPAQTPDAGIAPASIGALARVAWVPLDPQGRARECLVGSATEWRCPRLSPEDRGGVVLVGVRGVAIVPVGVPAEAPPAGEWGRFLRLAPGGAAPDVLDGVRIDAWKPERSSVRPGARRLLPAADGTVAAVLWSPTLAWVAGARPDPDAYLLVQAPAIATVRLSLSALAAGPPDVEVPVQAEAPFDLGGRVETKAGEGVDGATVDLFEPLAAAPDDPAPLRDRTLLRRAFTQTGADGGFVFPNLGPGRFYVVVIDGTRGRAAVEAAAPGPPLVVRLTPPRRIRGRVLRRNLPVPGARVRFVPDAAAWAASVDPMRYLAEEIRTGPDGRFSLALPPDPDGSLEIIPSANGGIIRGPVPSVPDEEVDLGDIAVPDPIRVTIRLLNADDACTLVATGPLSGLGLSQVRAAGHAGLYWLDLPEPGTWALGAECGRRAYSVQPPMVTVSPGRPAPAIEVVLVDRDAA